MKKPFEAKDIEDVRIIVKAKGKHYSMVPDEKVCKREEARHIRRLALEAVMTCHNFVDTALEDLKTENA